MELKELIADAKTKLAKSIEKGQSIATELEKLGKEHQVLFQTAVGQRITLVDNLIRQLSIDSIENQRENWRLEGELRAYSRMNGKKPANIEARTPPDAPESENKASEG